MASRSGWCIGLHSSSSFLRSNFPQPSWLRLPNFLSRRWLFGFFPSANLWGRMDCTWDAKITSRTCSCSTSAASLSFWHILTHQNRLAWRVTMILGSVQQFNVVRVKAKAETNVWLFEYGIVWWYMKYPKLRHATPMIYSDIIMFDFKPHNPTWNVVTGADTERYDLHQHRHTAQGCHGRLSDTACLRWS